MDQRLFQSWLALQCQAVPNLLYARATLTLADNEARSARWPAAADAGDDLDSLLSMVRSSRGTVVIAPRPGDQSASDASAADVLKIAYPIEHEGELLGAVAVAVTRAGPEQQSGVERLLQWGNTWFGLLMQHSRTPSISNEPTDHTATILTQALQPASFQEAAMSLVGVLAHHYQLERVSVGLVKDGKVAPVALSDSADIPATSELSGKLSELMGYALDLDDTYLSPLGNAFAVVLKPDVEPLAVLLFEARQDRKIDDALCAQVKQHAALTGALLALKAKQDESLLRHCRMRIRTSVASLREVSRSWRFASTVALALLVAVVLFGKSVHLVNGRAVIEGAVHRAVIAPFDSYVAAAYARAGETVDAGFVLAELDDQDLRLEHRQLQSDKAEVDKQFRKALAALDHAQARILKAQIDRANAKLERLTQRLERTQLTAPFAGVIVSGDLSRSLGKPVEQGEVLFEIAPLQAYRVAIDVPDKDITAVAAGQSGTLLLAALATEHLGIEVVNITNMPSDKAEPGKFRVEARLHGDAKSLRPGMRGIAKVAVGSRSRLWIWTHDLIAWLRYQLWSWLP